MPFFIRMQRIHIAQCILASIMIFANTLMGASANESKPPETILRIVVGAAAGGNFDLSARLVARNMPSYLGSNWTMIVSNMPSAGSLSAANFVLKNSSEREPMIAALTSTIITNYYLSPTNSSSFDPALFDWLGSTSSGDIYCLTIKDRPRKKSNADNLILGATSVGSPSSSYAFMVRHIIGPHVKPVHGYQGLQEMLAAIEKGEIDSFCGISLAGIEELWPDRYSSGNLSLTYVFPVRDHLGSINQTTNALDFVKQDDREAFRVFTSQQTYLRPFGVPLTMPKKTRIFLKDAFEKIITSNEFLNASSMNGETAKGDEVTKAISQIGQTSPETLARIRQMISEQ